MFSARERESCQNDLCSDISDEIILAKSDLPYQSQHLATINFRFLAWGRNLHCVCFLNVCFAKSEIIGSLPFSFYYIY